MNRLGSQLAKIWRSSGRTLSRREDQDGKFNALQVDSRLIPRLRNVLASLQSRYIDKINMESSCSQITPPDTVKGMTQLSQEAFTKVVKIPAVKIPKSQINNTQKSWKKLLFKKRGIKSIAELSDSDPEKKTHCLILLDPGQLQTDSLSEEQKITLQKFGLDLDNPDTFEVKLDYNNWSFPEIIRAVLPSDADSVTSFTQIGHIAHLNLKDVILPYKYLIGNVILDKLPIVKTVVNKVSSIDNTYRNFQMELLAGEEKYITQIKEHGSVFELDFSKVYWNSRLSTEHHKIVDLVEKGSVVYDVFAGIGPFSVPVAKKKHCIVFANDLNPSSYEYLMRNIQLNKIVSGKIKAFNMDGRDFIKTVVKNDLIDRIVRYSTDLHKTSSEDVGETSENVESDTFSCTQITNENLESSNISVPFSYVIMNLPAMAIDFLDAFKSILHDLPSELKKPDILEPFLPYIYCYTFSTQDTSLKDMEDRVKVAVGQSMPESCNVRLVRNVAPKKEMMCVSFKLWPDLVLSSCNEDNDDKKKQEDFADTELCKEPDNKRQKLIS
uniref:tRNA (guanine(37)-N1)-methyltransferase n=3 Tax=Arion vulgaris TaxID=1028688 RepID=A0A0B7ARY6_9EUPU